MHAQISGYALYVSALCVHMRLSAIVVEFVHSTNAHMCAFVCAQLCMQVLMCACACIRTRMHSCVYIYVGVRMPVRLYNVHICGRG